MRPTYCICVSAILAIFGAITHADDILVTACQNGNVDIFLVDTTTGKSRNLTNDRSIDRCPSWSSDGQRIVFCSDRDGVSNVFQMDADGTNVRQITQSRTECRYPTFSPDGKKIAFCEYAGNPHPVRIIVTEIGIGSRILTSGQFGEDGFDPIWSPNGKYLAFSGYRGSQTWGLFVLDVQTLNVQKIFSSRENQNGSVYPAWSPDGEHLAFGDQVDKQTNLYIVNRDGSNIRPLTTGETTKLLPSWSPDGSKIAYRLYKNGTDASVQIINVKSGAILEVQTPATEKHVDGDRIAWRPQKR